MPIHKKLIKKFKKINTVKQQGSNTLQAAKQKKKLREREKKLQDMLSTGREVTSRSKNKGPGQKAILRLEKKLKQVQGQRRRLNKISRAILRGK